MMFVVVWCLTLWLVCLCLVLCGLSELMMTSAVGCPLWSSVYVCHKVECAFTCPVRIECGMFVMYCMQCCMSVCCFIVRGCAVSRRYIDVCNCDMFSVVNVYLDHLKFCVVCINGRRYVCCGECYVVSNVCDGPTSCLVHPIGTHCREVMYIGCFGFRGEIGICVVNKQFELLEFVFDSVYVDLQYDDISLSFTTGSVCLCGVCSPVVVIGLSVRLSWYPMAWVQLLR